MKEIFKESAHNTCVWLERSSLCVPAPSRLYCITPEGIGTSLCESLTSYVSRVADTHKLSASNLVRHVVSPFFTHSYFNPDKTTSKSFEAAAAMNGRCNTSEQWVQAFSSLTSRSDLSFTTLLPFRHIVPDRDLLRKCRAWCPACLQQWVDADQTVYEPLLWKIKVVNVCHVHRCVLSERCPHCAKELPNFAQRIIPGYCLHCGGWLGSHAETDTVEELDPQIWAATTVGDLIAAGPDLAEAPTAQVIADFIRWLIDHRMKDNTIRSFARLLQVNHTYVLAWLNGDCIPTLPNLIRTCHLFKIDFKDIITGEFTRQAKGAIPSGAKLLVKEQEWTDWKVILSTMTSIIEGSAPPMTVHEIALRNGCHVTGIYRKFPALCKEVTATVDRARKLKQEENLQEIRHQYEDFIKERIDTGLMPTKAEMFRKCGGRSKKRQDLALAVLDDFTRSASNN